MASTDRDLASQEQIEAFRRRIRELAEEKAMSAKKPSLSTRQIQLKEQLGLCSKKFHQRR